MCGITGFFDKTHLWNESNLQHITSFLSHRGPDADGTYFNNGIGLGHRRLSIIDLSSGANQPMFSSDGRYVMVFNGEIYNYKEIAAKHFSDYSFKTTSDSEVILELFAKIGVSFLEELNGMFAIAIYDTIADELFVFRDRLGIKPLVYYRYGNRLAFASEIKALRQLEGVSTEIDMTSLNDYLFLEYVPSSNTIFKDIKKLPAGHFIRVSKESFSIFSYYDIAEKIQWNNSISLNKSIEGFKDLLFSSVKMQTVSDVPLGAFLSGGTDSSLICAAFQIQSDTPVNTFTIGFNVPEFDESVYAGKVAEVLGTKHRLTMSSETEALGYVGKLVKAYDEPFATPSTLPSMLVCEKAREFVTVAMSGDGGDELFMGYGYYNWYSRLKRIYKYGGNTAIKTASALLSLMGNRYKRASRILDYPDFLSIWPHVWSQEQYMFNEKEISALTGTHYTHNTLKEEWSKINNMHLHPFEKISLFDLKNYLSNNLLYKMDIASMYSGLEVRVPLLDHRLVEFSAGLPLDMKINMGEQKFLMKKVLEEFLPSELIYRKKWGFPAPLHKWLKSDLSFLIDDLLDPAKIRRQGILNPLFVTDLVKKYRSGEEFHYKRIWALIFFSLWYSEYIDGAKS